MSNQLYVGLDMRIASDVTFMPNLQDPKKNHAMVSAICNRGTSGSGKELRDDITLNFWGAYAGVAATYLYKGKQVNITGRLQSYTEDKGQTNAAGKRMLDRKVEVTVLDMNLLGDSMKEMERIFAGNVAVLKAQGRLPAEFNLTCAELLKSSKGKPVEFNEAEVRKTGRYGRPETRVWTKDVKFWDTNIDPNAVSTTPAPDANVAAELAASKSQVETMQKQIAEMQAGKVENTEGTTVLEAGASDSEEDPFEK